jgi:hypothetical protein
MGARSCPICRVFVLATVFASASALSPLIGWPSTFPGDHDDVVGCSDVERIEPRSNRCSIALEAKQPRPTAMKCGSAMRLTRVKNELQHLMLNQGVQKS